MLVIHAVVRSQTGEKSDSKLVLNDWIDVQDQYYRYLAIDDVGGIVIRIVIAEYLACEVAWRLESPNNPV